MKYLVNLAFLVVGFVLGSVFLSLPFFGRVLVAGVVGGMTLAGVLLAAFILFITSPSTWRRIEGGE